MGITPSWPIKTNSGARGGIRAAQKEPERDDKHTFCPLYDDDVVNSVFLYAAPACAYNTHQEVRE